MKHIIFKTATIACLIFATSCASTKYLSIDVLQPARVSFSKNIVNVAIVDNAGATIQDADQDVAHSDLEIINSKTKEIFLSSLEQFMNEEKFFNEVKLYPTPIRTDKEYGRQVPLRKSTIIDVAKEMDADAVVALDVFEAQNKESIISVDGWIFNAAQGNTNIMFRIYDASGTAITPIMATEDSITWLSDKSMHYESALSYHQQLALQLSEGMTKQLIPYWESQERWYYTDGTKLMKEANKYAQKGEWAEAAKVWGAAFEAETKDKQKAKIASNIAFANENLGDISNATTWIRISSNLLENDKRSEEYERMTWYKKQLLQREQNNPKALEQVGVEVPL